MPRPSVIQQRIDHKVILTGNGRPKERSIDLFISQVFDEFEAEAFLQRHRHEWKSFPVRANDTRCKRMKRTRGRNAHADSALLASRRAPARFKCMVKTREYCAGVVEEAPAGVGQLNPARLATKQLYIKFPF